MLHSELQELGANGPIDVNRRRTTTKKASYRLQIDQTNHMHSII